MALSLVLEVLHVPRLLVLHEEAAGAEAAACIGHVFFQFDQRTANWRNGVLLAQRHFQIAFDDRKMAAGTGRRR